MKSTLFKNALLIFFVVVMAVNAAATGSQAIAPAAGRKSFSILNWEWSANPIPPDVDPNNNKWVNVFKRELPNIDIEWVIVPESQVQQRINILVGSGDFPDVLPMNMTQMIQWADMGVTKHIDGYYQSHYRNIFNFLTEDDLKVTKYNNHQYGILAPGNRLENPGMMVLRTDWLAKLNLQMPKNLDELYNVLKAFTFNDPDGNGRDDTYGIAGSVANGIGFQNMGPFFASFGVQPGANFTRVGNQIVPDFIRPEMKTAAEYLARLYREGIMDKDTLNMAGGQLEDKGVRGILGMFGFATNGIAARIYPNMKNANPNARVEMFVPFTASDGRTFTPVGRNGGRMYGVSSRAAHVDAIMEFFNWMIEEDKSRQPYYSLNWDKIHYGTVGVDSEPLGDKFLLLIPHAQLTPEAVVDLYRNSYRTHMGTMQAVGDNVLFEITRTRVANGMIDPIFEQSQQLAARIGIPNAVAIMGPAYAEYMTDIQTYWEETLATVVAGSKPITAIDDFIRFFYANGGQKIIDEVNAMNR